MEVYQELLSDLKSGKSRIYIQKGDLNISLEILNYQPICISDTKDGCSCSTEIGTRMSLADNNQVDIYRDEIIKKVRRPPDVIAKFDFCYKVCAIDNDKSFYVASFE